MSQFALMLVGGLTFVVLALFFLAILARSQARREDSAPATPSPQDCARLKAEAEELESVARNAFDAASRAVDEAVQTQADLADAEAKRERAWHAHSAAAKALGEAQDDPAAPADNSQTDAAQLDIAAAARAAYRRGDLSVEEFRAVWQRVDGLDATAQQTEQRLSRLRYEEAEAWRDYHAAAFTERAMRRACDIAQVAARALEQEAVDAAQEAQLALIAWQACRQVSSRRRRPAPADRRGVE